MGNLKQITYEHFQSEKSSTCDLLISISQNNFSYAIVNPELEILEVLFDQDLTSPIEEAFNKLVEEQQILRLPYKNIKICVHSFNFTFIPQSLYSDSSLANYSKFLDCTEDGEMIVNCIRPARIKNVFQMSAALYTKVTDVFPGCEIFNQATVFIESIGRVMKESFKTSLFLNLQNSILQAAVIDRSSLLYYNIFNCRTVDDLSYFLLMVIRKLELDITQTSVSVAGEISLKSSYYDRIRKYFEDVSFADSRRIISQPDVFGKIPTQTYLTLLGLALCQEVAGVRYQVTGS